MKDDEYGDKTEKKKLRHYLIGLTQLPLLHNHHSMYVSSIIGNLRYDIN